MDSKDITSDTTYISSNTGIPIPASLADEHHQAKKEGRLEHFLRKHGLHAVGTQPQDNVQQNDPLAIYASGGKGPAEETEHGKSKKKHKHRGGPEGAGSGFTSMLVTEGVRR